MARYILAHPHVRQIVLPASGARLMLATDGVWDAITAPRAFALLRSTPAEAAAERLCCAALRGQVCLPCCL
jgi:serine/threonine protein phosphatase PrpC